MKGSGARADETWFWIIFYTPNKQDHIIYISSLSQSLIISVVLNSVTSVVWFKRSLLLMLFLFCSSQETLN